jgi:hypothetical protein
VGNETIVIRHSIPLSSATPSDDGGVQSKSAALADVADRSYLLRSGSRGPPIRLPAGLPSRAAWASAEGMGREDHSGEGCLARALAAHVAAGSRAIGSPLPSRQHRVGVGLLPQDEPAVDPTLGGAASPVQDPEFAQPLQRGSDRAHAHAGLAGEGRIGRVQSAGAVVQGVEDQAVGNLDSGSRDESSVPFSR